MRLGFARPWVEFAKPWVQFPGFPGFDSLGSIPGAGLRCVFSSDPAVSFSIFVGAEGEENLTSSLIP